MDTSDAIIIVGAYLLIWKLGYKKNALLGNVGFVALSFISLSVFTDNYYLIGRLIIVVSFISLLYDALFRKRNIGR